MTADPFLIVKEEVLKSLSIAEKQLQKVKQSDNNEKNINELNNTLKGISWDLEDLEETLTIVEKDPEKFPVAFNELYNRKQFVEETKEKLGLLRDRLEKMRSKEKLHVKIAKSGARFTSISIEEDHKLHSGQINTVSTDGAYNNDDEDASQIRGHQQLLLKSQDEQLERLGDSVSVLKSISKQMGDELDDQAVLLDEFGQEMDKTESRMDASMKKMARLMHLTNDKRQWCAIGVLLAIVILLVVLLAAL